MGLLFVAVLAGILIGYGWLAPLQANLQDCASPNCFDRIALGQQAEPRSTTLSADSATIKETKEKSAAAPKSRKHSSARLGANSGVRSSKRTERVKTPHPPTKLTVSASDRQADASDPVLSKAKISVAAKMEDPASAEFGDMDRAIRKNTLGRAVDTICGHVRGKTASGGDTGERPFLYLVKEDDAYVVDGKPDSAAAIAYRNICN